MDFIFCAVNMPKDEIKALEEAYAKACLLYTSYDYNRMNLLIAVLEKRAGYFFGNLDVYINIVGGIAPVSYTHLGQG